MSTARKNVASRVHRCKGDFNATLAIVAEGLQHWDTMVKQGTTNVIVRAKMRMVIGDLNQ